jgi:hypothetical protein
MADTSPCQTWDGAAWQVPNNFEGISGQSFTVQYPSAIDSGMGWQLPSKPDAVNVPGGFVGTPDSGAFI